MRDEEDISKQSVARRIWIAADLPGISRTVLQTLLAIVSPWVWFRGARAAWRALDPPRVLGETGSAILALVSPSAWLRSAKSFWQWLELRRLGKGFAAMPVTGAKAGAGAMGTIVRVSRPIILLFVPLTFVCWLVMGGGGKTDPRLKVARLPLHPVKEKRNEKLDRLLRLLDKKPNSVSGHIDAAAEFIEQGRLSDAQNEFQQAYSIDQKNTEAVTGLQDIANKVNDVESSLSLAKKAAEMQPDDPEIQNRLGSSYAHAGQYKEAVEAFERARQDNPNNVVVLLNCAAANAQLGRWDQAEGLCRKAIELKPNEELPQLLLADILVRKGTVAKGKLVLERLIAAHPRSAYAHQVLGGAQMDNGKLVEAIQSFHSAQELSPDWPLPYLGAGIANLKTNNVPEAERNFAIALRLRPDSVTAQLGMAGVYERKSQPKDAIRIYNDVLATQPNLLMPLNNLAYHYAEQGINLDSAYSMARQATQSFPGDKSVWDTLGFVCYRSNRTQEAVASLSKAMKMAPKNAIVRYHLGKALLLSGQRAQAVQAMQDALSLGLDQAHRGDAQAVIKDSR